MRRTGRPMGVSVLTVLVLTLTVAGGCVSGMTYRFPPPQSVTIGTTRGDDKPAAAAASYRGDREPVAQTLPANPPAAERVAMSPKGE